MANRFFIRLNFFLSIFLLVFVLVGTVLWADSNGLWEYAKDVRAGTFGSDEGGGNYAFPSNLLINYSLNEQKSLKVKQTTNFTNNVCLDGVCSPSWSKICTDWLAKNAINK